MARLFGRKSSTSSINNEDQTAASTTETKVKKSKSFKRIRGLLKKNKKRRAERTAQRRTTSTGGDDMSTVYGVDVEDRSVMTKQNTATTEPALLLEKPKDEKKAFILKVVLLLMDPDTRRFELLQLEFDSLKALVSDVLAQIPVSVTEEALRLQTYTGIAGRDGQEMLPTKLLASFCKGNEVLVAVPDGVPSKECVRLARPILSDDKVIQMLASSDVDASGWKEDAAKKKRKKSALKSRSAPSSGSSSRADKASSRKTYSVVLVVILALVLQVIHIYSSAPIKPGNTIGPGTWLSKCGLLMLWPKCENAYFHLSKQGVAKHYNADKKVTWQMEGGECVAGNDSCVSGMQVAKDGSIQIGGKPVKFVSAFSPDPSLSPWPFAEAPKLKISQK